MKSNQIFRRQHRSKFLIVFSLSLSLFSFYSEVLHNFLSSLFVWEIIISTIFYFYARMRTTNQKNLHCRFIQTDSFRFDISFLSQAFAFFCTISFFFSFIVYLSSTRPFSNAARLVAHRDWHAWYKILALSHRDAKTVLIRDRRERERESWLSRLSRYQDIDMTNEKNNIKLLSFLDAFILIEMLNEYSTNTGWISWLAKKATSPQDETTLDGIRWETAVIYLLY